MTGDLTVVDLIDPAVPAVGEWSLPGVVVGVCRGGVPRSDSADRWLDVSTFTVTDTASDDRRVVPVSDLDETITLLSDRVAARPVAAAICDDVLRAGSPTGSTSGGLIAESLAYSTLQAGAEFGGWLAAQGPRRRHEQNDAVVLSRNGSDMDITFNRSDRHNAFSNALRAGLIDGLTVALADPSVESVRLSGRGRSFCSGGDLSEFGMFSDPADAHLARTRHSPALLLDALTHRLGARCRANVHGAVLGSGMEMAAYCGVVAAHPDTVFGLPELNLGLVPGAGGTVSIPRRIGRWRTAYLVLTGRRIDTATALRWGLVDEVSESSRTVPPS
ncbi:enoyl-CoA hydratase/isomerase family protein [Williamsia sp. DF01-3]|uniref:enoyl-CoA hydratase/isomerase family protein n=1 Tax=Williamsia sp. DF01-3 TaxID=2934157 RepID=UPI0035B1F28E